jgi:hypothetical protein
LDWIKFVELNWGVNIKKMKNLTTLKEKDLIGGEELDLLINLTLEMEVELEKAIRYSEEN